MKILMLVNWKIKYCGETPRDRQPPDYYVQGQPYWFYRHFTDNCEVDVVDVSSKPWLERLEKEKLRFYIWQTLKVIPKLKKYDLVVSHGAQSGIALSLWRRFFKGAVKHIVFDIGSFNSAAESGAALKLMQFASKSMDGIIYHTSSQGDYYDKFFPWLVAKSRFVRFGTDLSFFSPAHLKKADDENQYVICVGYSKRDWDTLVKAYQKTETKIRLRLVGRVEDRFKDVRGVEQSPSIPIKSLMNQIYNALFCILPLESFNYSYGQMTLQQQMALGKCVVAARVPSLVDYVADGMTAVFYEPQNVDDLAQKMQCLFDDAEMRDCIGRQARTYLEKECNERIMAEQIQEKYQDVLWGGKEKQDA